MEGIKKIGVFVRPVQRQSSQNRHEQTSQYKYKESGREYAKHKLGKTKVVTKKGDSAAEELKFIPDPKTGLRLQAGLSVRIENPFYVTENIEDKVAEVSSLFNLPVSWDKEIQKIVKNKQITKQRYLEILAGVAPDTYTEELANPPDGFFITKDKDYRTFLQKFKIILYDRVNPFDSKTPRGRLAIQLIKNRPDKIALDKDSVNEAQHDFYIAEEFEEAIESQKTNDMENEAIAQYYMLKQKFPLTSSLNDSIIYHIGSICTDYDNRPLLKGEPNPILIDRLINAYIKNTSKHQAGNIKKFLSALNLYKEDKELFYTKYLIRKSINKGVVINKSGFLLWLSQKGGTNHKFKSFDAFETKIISELKSYEDGEENNAYFMLREEVKSKGGIIPTNV